MISKSGITSIILLIIVSVWTERTEAQKNLYAGSSWNNIDYVFDSNPAANTIIRNAAINSGKFIIGNPFPIDIDAYYGVKGLKQFITTPRFLDGTPITLGTITGPPGQTAPLIAPYPSYSWHNTTNCSGFTSIFRVAIDECNRLWVIDTGKIGDQQVCPPQIVVFDAETDVYLRIYKFPSSLVKEASLFVNLVVDVRNTCTDTMVYIADVNGFAIVVYDYRNNRAWRVQNKLFYPTPSNGTFTIAGETFDLMDGIFGMSLSPKNVANRQLYFHSLASISENSVLISTLDNAPLWQPNPDASPRSLVEIGIRDNSQSTVTAMDKYGNQYFGTLRPLGIGCWDTSQAYTKNNLKLLVQNDVTLQFISGLKIRKDSNGNEELWALSCRFQKIILGTRKTSEVNYRVQGIKTAELLGGSTKCNGPAFPRV